MMDNCNRVTSEGERFLQINSDLNIVRAKLKSVFTQLHILLGRELTSEEFNKIMGACTSTDYIEDVMEEFFVSTGVLDEVSSPKGGC